MRVHTPGPWLIDERTVYALHSHVDRHPSNRFWAQIAGAPDETGTRPSDSEIRANVQLIAAAPDLLECAKEAALQIEYLHQKFQATGTGEAVMCRLRAAIAKATGTE